MQNDEIKDVYAEHYEQYPDLVADREHPTYIHLMHFLPKDKSSMILDAACGEGKYALALKQLGYENVYAVDLFDELRIKEIAYKKCSIDDLPKEWKGKFDFIFCNSAIFYLENPQTGITEFYRCLKAGGRLFFTAHTKYSLWTLWRKFKLFLRMKSMSHLQGVHFDRDVDEYLQMLNKCGYRLIYVGGYYFSIVYTYVYKGYILPIGRKLGIRLPDFGVRISTERRWGMFRARHAYHSIIVAQK